MTETIFDDQELEAASEFLLNLLTLSTPQQLAPKIAKEQFNVELTDNQLNRVLGMFATTHQTLRYCVEVVCKNPLPKNEDKRSADT